MLLALSSLLFQRSGRRLRFGFFGETPDDIKLLKAIQEKINTIYDYLKDTERKQERLNADNWRGLDADLRDRISNIMAARSGPNLGKLSDASDDLTKAITAMFSLD